MRAAIFAMSCAALAAQDVSVEKQAALGKTLAEQVRRNTTPIESSAIQDYVSRLGARVAAGFAPGPFPFTFSVVNGLMTPVHEPVVLPGGYVFVSLSLLTSANDEAELAGMLAQAVARRPLISSAGGPIPLIFIGGFQDAEYVPVSALKGLREAEGKADQLAVGALSAAGFDPEGLLRYVERVQVADTPIMRVPPRAERLAELRSVIDRLPSRPQYIEDSSDFASSQKLARAEVAPPRLLNRPRLKRQ